MVAPTFHNDAAVDANCYGTRISDTSPTLVGKIGIQKLESQAMKSTCNSTLTTLLAIQGFSWVHVCLPLRLLIFSASLVDWSRSLALPIE